jgi:hypothetical protein
MLNQFRPQAQVLTLLGAVGMKVPRCAWNSTLGSPTPQSSEYLPNDWVAVLADCTMIFSSSAWLLRQRHILEQPPLLRPDRTLPQVDQAKPDEFIADRNDAGLIGLHALAAPGPDNDVPPHGLGRPLIDLVADITVGDQRYEFASSAPGNWARFG